MVFLEKIRGVPFLNNGLRTYIIVFLKNAAKKSRTHLDDFLADSIHAIKWPFYLYVSFYAGTRTLVIPPTMNKILQVVLLLFIIYYTSRFLQRLILHYTEKEIEKRKKQNVHENSSMIRVLGNLAVVAVWILALLLILANLGINITPLIAGLGIGGIAIAFALQNILEDIFSSFSIYFDKPFKEGDFIIIGSDMGVVKHIGIKTTRIQTLQGQELVISNRELTSSRINNYKRMEKRRIQFNFGVEYGTSTKKLKKINEIVKKIIDKIELTTLDRVHFKSFGDSSLLFEVVYYLNTSDYNQFMDVQQEINFKLKDALEKEKISMAFPTQTIHLVKD